MQRVTVSLEEPLAKAFDQLLKARGYQNRSEAVRDLLRQAVEERRLQEERQGHCVANLSFIYNHHERDLSERLTETQHAHHDLVVSAMHVHLDHEHCMETIMLKGPTEEVQDFADSLRAERGVRHGSLNLVSVDTDDHHGKRGHSHAHGHSHKGHDHHLSPKRG